MNVSDPVDPSFTAPLVALGGATLTFELVVQDGEAHSEPDQVNVTVKNVNTPPAAHAGPDQTVAEGATVQLDGSDSFDPDGDPLTFHWIQTAGTPVTLSDVTAARPIFAAPLVGLAGDTLAFMLTVNDRIDSAGDSVLVAVENVNHSPIADAGSDQTRDEAAIVSLDGSASIDPDGDSLTFSWTQVSGSPVALANTNSSTPSFTAPLVPPGGEVLLFELVVSDGLDDSDPDTVAVTVQNINDPPACELARPDPAILWPPNHKLVEVQIAGVSDPDNDRVAITITAVTQDEPLNGLGDGDTSPDAVLEGDKVLLRAERQGGGNGRVYRVHFTAEDAFGTTCAGSVTVCVPHDRRPGTTCTDDGQAYDSLGG